MGLFGSRKETHVASTVYNMAGDEKDRADFLKTTVVGSVVHNRPSIADVITKSYLEGPGIRFRSFVRWAGNSGYSNRVGHVTGTIVSGNSFDRDLLIQELPSPPPGSTIELQTAKIGEAEYGYWVDQYVAEEFPERLGTDYISDFQESTNTIMILWEDDTTSFFEPQNFDKFSRYIYASYMEKEGDGTLSSLIVFIYKEGSGNSVLDGMFHAPESLGDFFPYIPLRIDGKFIGQDFMPDIYQIAKKAYRRSLTGRFDKTIKDLEDNESIDDIDYAYVVFGVSLNVLENACKKYIYTFFKAIHDMQLQSGGSDPDWIVEWNRVRGLWEAWIQWKLAQNDPLDPEYGTPEPPTESYPELPSSSINVSSKGNPPMNYDMTIEWTSIQEMSGTGRLKDDAKRDELWFTVGDSESFDELIWLSDGEEGSPSNGQTLDATAIILSWQETPNTWRRLRIRGLHHKNHVYGGKTVNITAPEALMDPEESGFIIPLHEDIYRSMGLIDGTQMATASAFMVFNSYEIVKKKWYQTGIFKVILIIIIIVVSIYTAGSGAAASGGLLGTNAAVGAALGFSGTMAIVVGAVANAMAAMLLAKAITAGAVALFGDKWGAIIGAIASVIALQVGTSMMQGQSFSASFGNMMRADNILNLTMAAGDGYMGYINASTQQILQETQDVIQEYEEESRKIRELWAENIGFNRGIIDPLELTEAFGVTMESVDSFLQRTLMTGSDVADLSLDMLTDFVDMTLSTELPT